MFTVSDQCIGYRQTYVLTSPVIKLALALHPNTNRGSVSTNHLDSTTPFHKDNNQDLAFQYFCKQDNRNSIKSTHTGHRQLEGSLALAHFQKHAHCNRSSHSNLNKIYLSQHWVQQLYLKTPIFWVFQPKPQSLTTGQLMMSITQRSQPTLQANFGPISAAQKQIHITAAQAGVMMYIYTQDDCV